MAARIGATFPPGIEAVPPVGSALTPDLERIAQLRPTRILVDGSGGVPVAELNALAPVEVLDWLTLAEVRASVTRLGALTGQTTAAERIRASFAPLEAPPPADAPSVLLALGGEILERGEVWYIKRNSLHGAALHAAGGRNAIDRDVEGAPVLSLEALLSLDPPAILVLTVAPVTPATKQALVDEWSRLTPLRALRDGRFEVIGGPTVMATGPEILHTVDAMRQPLQRWRGE